MKRFEDNINVAVFSTKFVVKDKNEITYVAHDIEDRAWKFFSNDNYNNLEDVAMLVSLEEMIKIDNSILEIADMPLGYYATRKSIKDKWILQKQQSPTKIN